MERTTVNCDTVWYGVRSVTVRYWKLFNVFRNGIHQMLIRGKLTPECSMPNSPALALPVLSCAFWGRLFEAYLQYTVIILFVISLL